MHSNRLSTAATVTSHDRRGTRPREQRVLRSAFFPLGMIGFSVPKGGSSVTLRYVSLLLPIDDVAVKTNMCLSAPPFGTVCVHEANTFDQPEVSRTEER